MIITLKGEPKSTSHIYHYHCKFGRPAGYVTADGKALKADYQRQAKAQWHRKPLSEPLQATIRLFFGTRRRSDWDNFHKLSMDALTGIVWDDDGQLQEVTVIKDYDKSNPRIEIALNTLP